jgi:hypothetical protein
MQDAHKLPPPLFLLPAMSHRFFSRSATGKICSEQYHSSASKNLFVRLKQRYKGKIAVLQIQISQTDFLQMYQIPGHILLSASVL